MITFSDLVGEHCFQIVPAKIRHPIDDDADGVMFTLDDTTYLVFEDPDDGYRSAASPILSFQGSAYEIGGGGSRFPVFIHEDVVCSHRTAGQDELEDGADILEVRSKITGELIFEVGTANVGGYYPAFVNSWNPAGMSAGARVKAER